MSLTPERYERAAEVFHGLLERDGPERDAYLEASCTDDPALRELVTELLAGHAAAGPVDRLAGWGGRSADAARLAVEPPAGIEARLATALADRYRIEGELAHGGTATVYLARDLPRRRQVAIKVLRPELAATLGPDRFLREIEIAAKLHHPHILPLYDSGEVGGFLYYVMPRVEGETLRQRLKREGQLPLEDALAIAREVADALGYAHGRGVVHRDIKPENILLDSGHAVLADFGIARAITEAGGDQLTDEGLAIGTPAYMSPEQATGSPKLDGRSDLYSLACVAYEMLGGEPPFTGPSARAVLGRHSLDPVPPLRTLRPALPAGIQRVLERTLAKDPADRYATAGQFRDALEAVDPSSRAAPPGRPGRGWPPRPAIAAAAAIVVALGAYLFRDGGAGASAPAEPAMPRLAVLTLENLGRAEDDYFADGISDEIRTRLARLAGLNVIARTSAIEYRGSRMSAREIGQELGVEYILRGTVRWAHSPDRPSRVRIAAQLIDAASDRHLWSERYEREIDDLFAIQEEIAVAILGALQIRLGTPVRATLAQRPTDDFEAYNLYLQGLALLHTRREDALVGALDYFERAIALDSGFARAHAGVAQVFAVLPIYSNVDAEEAIAKAREAGRRALAHDSTLAEAHAALGYVLSASWDWDGADRAFRRALQLDPGNATAHQWYGLYLAMHRRLEEALEALRRARELDPLSLIINSNLGSMLYATGRLDEALAQLRHTHALHPNPVSSRHLFSLASVYAAKGMHDEALAVLDSLLGTIDEPEESDLASAVHVFARAGRPDRAREILTELHTRVERRDTERLSLARAYAGLGERDRALDFLEQAVERREPYHPGIWFIGADPLLDTLRTTARFRQLLARMGLRHGGGAA
jgi:eukaryotic-like serine/threonine-protein kinase